MDETLIALNLDDSCARFVGTAADGRQFFLTTPYTPAAGAALRHEYLALYLFDADGKLLEARVRDLGPRRGLRVRAAQAAKDELLAELGTITPGGIHIFPFAVEQLGLTFGLVPDAPDDDEGEPLVLAMPGAYMEFSAPWDDGYDTFEEPDGKELLLLSLS